MGEHFHRRFRRAEVRLVRLGKGIARLRDLRLAHPAGQQRFAVRVGKFNQGLCRFQRFGHRLRREDGQHAVHVVIFQAGFDGMMVTIRLGIADDVHRIAVRPIRRQMLVEIFDGGIRQGGHRKSQVSGTISRHHAGAAAIGDDGEAVADRTESA